MKRKKRQATDQRHPDDISIGPNEWIRFVDIEDRAGGAVNLDRLLGPTEPFWRALEVHCVAECCGINAHGFWPRDIWNAARACRDPKLSSRLAVLKREVDAIHSACVRSDILNQYFDRAVFLRLLDHLIATLNRM